MNRRRVGVWHKTLATASLVHAGGADRDALFGFENALRVVRGLAALDANRVGFGDVFGDSEQLRHRLPRLAGVVLIQSGDDHAHAASAGSVRTPIRSLFKNLPFSMSTTFVIGSNSPPIFRSVLPMASSCF